MTKVKHPYGHEVEIPADAVDQFIAKGFMKIDKPVKKAKDK